MKNRISGRSKKGMTLPVAMAIGIFLVLIASSLLFIALNSMSRTSTDISGRQAYLNVKSALEYARAYYNAEEDLTEVGDGEYMIMRDEGGTTSQGADISKNQADTDNATTFVIAQYIPAEDKTPASLKLSGFSRYSDPFGKRAAMARLSLTFTVGGSSPNRYTPFTIPGTPIPTASDTITLHVKQPKDMNYQLSYYVWTYEDNPEEGAGAYEDYKNQQLEKKTNVFDIYEYKDGSYRPNVNKLNKATYSGNSQRPNGIWETNPTNGRTGPGAVMATTSDDDLWTTGAYTIRNGRVPWFNVIFARKGTVLSNFVGSGYQDCQVNEMFHLWYLDPSDKNIYFEFSGKKKDLGYVTKYYTGKTWDGRQGLEYETDKNSITQSTVVAYVKNQKTTVHLRIHGKDDGASTPSIAAPVISGVANKDGTEIDTTAKSYIYSIPDPQYNHSNDVKVNKRTTGIVMEYEGCGWWVANIDTNREFRMTVTVQGVSYDINTVKAYENNEAWVVLRNGTLNCAAAEDRTGAVTDSYVTVHAKVADYTKRVESSKNPKIYYKIVGTDSSAKRNELQRRVHKAMQLKSSDYTPSSFAPFLTALNNAITVLNNKNFVSEQPGATIREKMDNADHQYDIYISALEEAEEDLDTVGVTNTQLEPLTAAIVKVEGDGKTEGIIKAEESRGIYDYEAYLDFMSESGAYKVAKKAYVDTSNLTTTKINQLANDLEEAIKELNDNHQLDRVTLGTWITTAEPLLYNEHYTEESRNALRNVLDDHKVNGTTVKGARSVYAEKYISQRALDDQSDALEEAIRVVKNSLSTPLDTTRLNELLAIAQDAEHLGMVEKVNCTDETYKKLQDTFDSVQKKNAEGKLEFQEDVEAAVKDLEAAINAFTVIKPTKANDLMAQDNKIIVWVLNKSEYPFELDAYKTAESEQAEPVGLSVDLAPDENNFRSVVVDKAVYEQVSLMITNSYVTPEGETVNEEVSSDRINIRNLPDNNIAFVVDEDGEIKQTTTTAVYFPQLVGDLTGKIGKETVKPCYEAPYKVFRFITDSKKKMTVTQTYIPAEGGNKVTVNFSINKGLGAGDYIAQTDGTGKKVTTMPATQVYPKLTVNPEEPPAPTGTVANDSDFDIQNMATNWKHLDLSEFDDAIAEGQQVIVVDVYQVGSEYGKYKNNLYVYIWDQNDKSITGGWNATAQKMLLTSNGRYMYTVVDSSLNMKGCLFLKGATANDGNKIDAYDAMFPTADPSKPIYGVHKDTEYSSKYGKTVHKVTTFSYTPPVSPNPFVGKPEMEEVQEANMDGKNLRLAYVGGNKVRITNRAFADIYGEGQKTNAKVDNNGSGYTMNLRFDGSGYAFGGDGGTSDNENRIGCARLSAYTDWYEIKIPVPKDVKYTFELKGMNPGEPGTKTTQIRGIENDVWIAQLDNVTKKDGRYSKVNLLSFNLEEDNIPESLTVYLRKPSNWGDVKLYAHGVGSITKTISPSGTTSEGYYIFKGITKETPYLAFSSNIGDDPVIYERELKGGDYVLFDPNYNDGTGDGSWREYKSATEKLKSELRDVQSCYLGHFLVDTYDKNGEVVDVKSKYSSSAENTHYSTFYQKAVINNNAFFTEGGTNGAYQIDMAKVENYTESQAQQYYDKLHTVNKAMKDLYQQLSNARSYISKAEYSGYAHKYQNKVTDGIYPEFAARRDYKRYSDSSIATLRQKMFAGENTYLNNKCVIQTYSSSLNNTYYQQIISATKAIKQAVAGLDQDREDAIGCVLYDAQEKVNNGSTFRIRYRKEKGGDFVYEDVREYNPENFPIIFIVPNNANNTIYDVQFLEQTLGGGTGGTPLGAPKDMMRMSDNQEWVFFDSATPFWTQNTTYDYRQINSEIFMYSTDFPTAIFQMKQKKKKTLERGADNKPVYDDYGDPVYNETPVTDSSGKVVYGKMTLLFTYDTEVTTKTSSYTIKAGAYTFNDGYTSPVSEGKLDLFSTAAQSYFTNAELADKNSKTYGRYINNAVDAVTDLEWHNGAIGGVDDEGNERPVGVFKTGYNSQAGYNVNFDVRSGDFLTHGLNYTYLSTEGLYFRWSSAEPLYFSTPVILQADNLRIATMGTFDGTKGDRDPQFLLKSADASATQMEITFITDVAVKYADTYGKEHKFSIREGTYIIEKEDPDTDYIANIFNEKYWKTMEHVHSKSGNDSQEGPGSSKLKHGTVGR